MMFDIDDIASVGAVADIPGYMLPPEIWTFAQNMRYQDDSLVTMTGWEQTFNTPSGTPIAPHFAIPITSAAANYWLYTSLTKARVYNGVAHTDITRTAGGDYGATDSWQWNGTILGGIPILNNGVDVPQFWAIPYSVGTPLADLTNWDPTKRARVIRAFGSFLIAINLTEAGVAFPHRVLWSHPADAGFLPASWDDTDPTRDAGEADLPDVYSGVLVDALPLGSLMFLYKQSSIWKMRFVGGQQIFNFGQSAWLTTSGALGTRCVCVTGDGTKHIVATQNDIIWHDGNTVNSILNKRQRRRLQGELSETEFHQSFLFANPYNNEVWFCYPQQGSLYPDKALILNYKTAGGNDFCVTEADGITFRNAAIGDFEIVADEIWDAGTDMWITDTGPWSQQQRRRVVLCNPTNTKFYKLDQGETRDGTVFASTLRREGLALIGKKRNGDIIVDFQRRKMFKQMWPKITGSGPVNIQFGMQTMVDGATTWGGYATFDSATQVYCDPGIISGRAVGFEITKNGPWKIDGYKIDMVPLGEF